MEFEIQREAIEALLKRSIESDANEYQLSNLPINIRTEAEMIALEYKETVLAIKFLKYVTGSPLKELKAYAGKQNWVSGIVE